ncbi:16S rRNA (guanine(1516)-N(2))-methyltransferase [hydrothermal vent metagenome]|uniref:16S rRNA (Guanine(1516)-N(2))-methyltransferase n=1 Tax=hydrothermal vent metagenome TaxID=652676 RepID=A0A3B1A8Q2_9ZZZZ
MKDLVTVCFESENLAAVAISFAEKHALEVRSVETVSTPFILYYKEVFVELIDRQTNTAIHVDFLAGTLAHRRQYGGGKGQAIAKAIGLKQYKLPLNVLDATAGLAKDAFVLACLGCSLTLLEQNPVVAELVKNALTRAENEAVFKTIREQGFKLIIADAVDFLKATTTQPDIIYIDPMYPQRKKSAAVKKNMQILQKLVSHGEDKIFNETELLNQALITAKKRVVVKRPKGAPCLTDTQPTMSIESKITRYDVYVLT